MTAFAGTFGDVHPRGELSDSVVSFSARNGELLMWPALWSGPMVLSRVSADSFVVSTHGRFGVRFAMQGTGVVSDASIHGLSDNTRYVRLDSESPRPIQLLLDGHPADAARRYVAAEPDGADRFVYVARRFMRSAPTRSQEAVTFLEELSRLLPDEPDIHAARGDALLLADHRADATTAWERALELDPSNPAAAASLNRITGATSPAAAGDWHLPFPLQDLFLQPTSAEIERVRESWRRRDLNPRNARIIMRRNIDLNDTAAEARFVEHTVHDARHVGVVIVPEGAAGRRLPLLVETKGVSPSFPPLEVPDGLTSPHLMAASRGDVIYVAPSYRGERIVIGADTLTSEGDRRDAWDGATDDTIAFLRAAMQLTPEADTSRVCVFGRSRGGAVALLTGIREARVDCVVSWAAPTDWFSRMDLVGWTQQELVADGLRNHAEPGETGGQFINYFLDPAIEGRRGLDETRLHMIASSAMYFAGGLPLAQVHWGLEDSIVPSVNGTGFVDRYADADRPEGCLDIRFHPDAGHDQDRQLAPQLSRQFLVSAFELSQEEIAHCRPAK